MSRNVAHRSRKIFIRVMARSYLYIGEDKFLLYGIVMMHARFVHVRIRTCGKEGTISTRDQEVSILIDGVPYGS